MTKTMYIVACEQGFSLIDSDGMDHGVADTLKEAIASAKEAVTYGVVENFCIAD